MYLFWLRFGCHCCVQAFSSCSKWGYSSLRGVCFSLWCLFSLQSTGCRVWAQYLQHTGLVTTQHVGSSLTRDWTCVHCDSWGRKGSDMTERLNWTELNWYCIGSQILNCESPRKSLTSNHTSQWEINIFWQLLLIAHFLLCSTAINLYPLTVFSPMILGRTERWGQDLLI